MEHDSDVKILLILPESPDEISNEISNIITDIFNQSTISRSSDLLESSDLSELPDTETDIDTDTDENNLRDIDIYDLDDDNDDDINDNDLDDLDDLDESLINNKTLEEIVELINAKKYINVMKIISRDELNQTELEKLIYYLVYDLIKYDMEQKTFVKFMSTFIQTKIDMRIISLDKQIIQLLIDYEYKIPAKSLKLLHKIKHDELELTYFMESFNSKMKLQFPNNLITIKFYEELVILQNYVKAFSKMNINPNIDILETEDIQKQFRINKDTLYDHYKTNIKDDILQRIILLKHRFGFKMLNDMHIDIITIDEYNMMPLEETIKYYCTIMKKIKRYVNDIIKTYCSYVRRIKRMDKMI